MKQEWTGSSFPYPGLRSFRPDETDIFFGREEHVYQILEKLERHRFLLITGSSGCGKSSLAHAGMIPALENRLLAVAGVDWQIATTRPGKSPLANLAAALTKAIPSLAPTLGESLLRRGPLGVKEIREQNPDQSNLLILVDQFEEIFRYHQHGNQNEADDFVNLLLESSRQESFPIYVVLTMRSNFLGDCSLFSGLPEAINQSQYLTPRLNREQIREAILGPAGVFEGKIEDSLTSLLLNDIGSDSDQLPLLQHCLMRLWNLAPKEPGEQRKIRLTLDLYQKTGGVKNSLSQHADEIFNTLTPIRQKQAEPLFRCLVERGPDKQDARRPIPLREVADVLEISLEEMIQIIDPFRQVDCGFLVPSVEISLQEDSLVDISHESLIRQWERLRQWGEEEAESAEFYRHLEHTALQWEKGKAALWDTPDLETALQWKKRQNLTSSWAKRYGKAFTLTRDFLQKSQEKQKERIQEEKEDKEQRARELFHPRLTHATLAARGEDYDKAKKILARTKELGEAVSPGERQSRNLLSWFCQLRGQGPEQIYRGAGKPLYNVAVSPDGLLLAGAGEDGTLVLFETQSGKLVKRLEGYNGHVRTVIFYPQQKWLVSGGDDGLILFHSLPGGRKLQEWKAPDEINAMALHPNGEILASGGGGKDNNITLWNLKTGKKKQTLEGHQGGISVYGLDFSSDGKLLASSSYDGTAQIWNWNKKRLWFWRKGKSFHTLLGDSRGVEGVSFQEGKRVAINGKDGNIQIWNLDNGKLLSSLQGHQNSTFGLANTEDGKRMISASYDRTLRVWDSDSGTSLGVLQGHEAGVFGVAVRDQQLFSSSNDGTLARWNLDWQEKKEIVLDLPGKPNSTAISPDFSKIAVGFEEGRLRLYSLPAAELLWENKDAHQNRIFRLSFSPDGQLLVSAGFDNTTKLWKVDNGELQQVFQGHKNAVYAVVFSPDGKKLATASYDGKIGLFSLDKKEGILWEAHRGKKVRSVAFDSTGTKLLSAGDNNQARLWSLQTNLPIVLQEFPPHSDTVMWADLSPNGKLVAVGGKGSTFRIYDTETAREVFHLVGHENTIYRVTFSPDSQQVASVSMDATVRLWDLTSGEELFSLRLTATPGNPTPLWDFAFCCAPPNSEKAGEGWIAVPLTRGKLVLYKF